MGGVSSRVGVLSLPTVLWALRWRHVRPNQKRQTCVLIVWFSSFFFNLAGETPPAIGTSHLEAASSLPVCLRPTLPLILYRGINSRCVRGLTGEAY